MFRRFKDAGKPTPMRLKSFQGGLLLILKKLQLFVAAYESRYLHWHKIPRWGFEHYSCGLGNFECGCGR
jgi:hypothetical protein